MDIIKIGTRKSQLALWQANRVSNLLNSNNIQTEIVPLSSGGDRSLGGDLSTSVGQFIHSIDAELFTKKIDIAVHSAKDVPVTYQDGICNLAYLSRGCTSDLLIFNNPEKGCRLEQLLSNSDETNVDEALNIIPNNGMVGTVSGRRQSFVLSRRPDVIPISARGDIETRLSRLIEGRFDALILAEVGIKRLCDAGLLKSEFLNLNAFRLLESDWPTAPGQGAIAVHCKEDRKEIFSGLREIINHEQTQLNVENERFILQSLGGGCLYPCGVSADGKNVNVNVAPSNWRELYSTGMSFSLKKYNGNINSFHPEVTDEEIITPEVSEKGPKIISTLNSDRLSRTMKSSGINVINLPVIDLKIKEENWPFGFVDSTISKREWPYLILTSPFASKCAVEISKNNSDIARIQWIAIGEGTARACFKKGVTVSLCAKARNAKELAGYIKSNFEKKSKFLLPRSSLSNDYLLNELTDAGYEILHWTGYENKIKTVEPCEIENNDVLLLSSPSSVKSWEQNSLPIPKNILCMGQTTLEAVKSTQFFAGKEVETLKGPTSEFLKMWWNQSRSGMDERKAEN